jgi:hypothetical protein
LPETPGTSVPPTPAPQNVSLDRETFIPMGGNRMTKAREAGNDAKMKNDLACCIPGMYRILDLHSEQSSGGLGEQVYCQAQ